MAEGSHQEVDGAGEDAGKHELEGQRHQALGYEEGGVVVEAVADLPPQQRLLRVPAARTRPVSTLDTGSASPVTFCDSHLPLL